jgi:hypothetical protein
MRNESWVAPNLSCVLNKVLADAVELADSSRAWKVRPSVSVHRLLVIAASFT